RQQDKKFEFARGVSLLDKASFTRYMSLMLTSGLSMAQGIDSLAEDTKNITMRKILNDLAYGLKSGKKVSEILGRYPNVFDGAFIAMVKAGEASGTLGEAFSYLSEKLRSEYELQRNIKGAMVYPVVIFIALILMGFVLVVFVLPRIGGVFKTMDIDLPLPTLIMLNVGEFTKEHLLVILPSAIVGLVLAWLLVPRDKLKTAVNGLLTKMPITGSIIRRIDYARLTRTLGVLLKSGVSITEAISIAVSTVSQPKLKAMAPMLRQRLLKGVELSRILKETKIFPVFITQMLTVGEKSGNLEDVLAEVGAYYAEEAESDLKNISQVIEPILVLVVGILVGLLVISIIAPIYKLIGDLQI
ncbi:MAG: type II secretion system F family protein, partial [bacterium]|nr:type II secretion system F family protein [bacterium]